ncbi:pentapeptide repeat-containing protein [Nonomuraea sp. 3N208]|uniref:pentapeptide repeat-containing protein n=1 Tax=Nonomuraea sp. 3N208 TaxID=3457421 RepID=UPI003FD1FA77
MRQQRRWRISRGWPIRLLIGIGAVFVLVMAVVVLPSSLAPGDAFDKAADAVRAQQETRGLLLQALVGLAVFLGAYVTWRQFLVSREQLQLNLRATAEQLQAARDQLAIAQQGQITDRFTRAVDQLGSSQLVVRMGGIHALARIAKDSAADVGVIAEILCSYVRQHAPAPEGNGLGATEPEAAMPHLVTRAADVQAVLTVLGRGLIRPDEQEPLRLLGTDLRRAALSRGNLVGADLEGVRLDNAWMPEARLDDVDLSHADLRKANLAGASLKGADLTDAILCGAHVEGACLREAILTGAQLDGVVANQSTTWPEGFDPQEAGVVVEAGHAYTWWRPGL